MSESSSDGGCLELIVILIVLWALTFGITYAGIHYKMDFSEEHGIQILEE